MRALLLNPYTAALLAVALAVAFDHATRRRGLDPPGFLSPARRTLAMLVLAFLFFTTVFGSLLLPTEPPDLTQIRPPHLFFSHALMLGCVVAWATCAWPRRRPSGVLLLEDVPQTEEKTPATPARATGMPSLASGPWPAGLGLRVERLFPELSLGLGAGLVAWAAVLAAGIFVALVIALAGGEDMLREASPTSPWIVYMAGLPVIWRLAIAVSAGVVEEILFRGLLQPRLGIAATTALFAAGHAGYGQPMLFVGVTLLSIIYGLLARWRGNVWAAIVAHTLFDAIQLLVVIPLALEAL